MGRHTSDDAGDTGDADGTSAWGMRWEAIDDPDSPDDPDGPEGPGAPVDPRRRGKIRALVAACVLGALAIVGVTVVAVRAAVDDVNERTGPQRIHERYDARYRSCVGDGSSPAACAERIFDRCAADPDWGTTPDEAAILDNCRFGPAARTGAPASSTS